MFGLTLSSMAPAFVDYRAILNTEMSMIGLFPMFQAIGIFCGSFTTVIFRYINRQVLLSALVVLQGLGTIFQPWSTSLWHLYVCIFVYGFGIGAWNGTNNVIIIELWQSRSPSVLQFSQFMYGLGTVLGPLLDRNFVLGEQICPGVFPKDCTTGPTTIGTTMSSLVSQSITANFSGQLYASESKCDQECLSYDRRPQLKIPLLIGGLLQILGAVMYFTMFFVKRYHFDKETQVEALESEEQKERYRKYVPRKTIVACIVIFNATGIMSEMIYMDFAPTFYQFCSVRLPASEASEMFSYVGIALTIGRFMSVFIAVYLKPWVMITYQTLIVFVGFIFQYYAQYDYKLLLASSIIICFGYSSIFICLYSFVGQYMKVTDRMGGLFIGSYNLLYMPLAYFIAKYVEIVPESFVFLELACVCVAIVAFSYVLYSVRNVPNDLIRKIAPVGGH
ncbi:uncharacterized protein LOC128959396 [Oppia nitens]|uniref:uncharacterized protein LOC128959396 n=1 Tax=Oppia nitens TaxID=1686743 RepID=UPI0023DADAED|nr:uncharacterized protein LOC128959396 [Oppia nitens]